MLNIPLLRSSRITAELKEISMMNSIKLANMPEHLTEKQNTFLLNSIIESVQGIESPLMWTVQERMLTIAQYIAATQEGSPDFEVGELRYSDFLRGNAQYQHDQYEIGIYEDDHWSAIPLLGIMVETIEMLEGEIVGIEGRSHWYLGCMACQLVVKRKPLDIESNDYDKQVLERMILLSQFPESSFIELLAHLNLANKHFTHLFEIAISETGIVAQSIEKEGTAPSFARFPAYSAITTATQRICGKSDAAHT